MSSTIDLAPLVGALMPVAVTAAGSLLTLASGWAILFMRRLAKDRLSQAQQDAIAAEIEALKSKASTWAGTFIAASATNLAGQKITVDSPIVAVAVNAIAKDISPALAELGWTPERIATLVTGEIGKLQPPPLVAPVQ